MNEEIILNYILKVLEYDETILKCVNLGFSPTERTKIELEMLKESKEYIKNTMKEKRVKQW